jgi:hypothetical protein
VDVGTVLDERADFVENWYLIAAGMATFEPPIVEWVDTFANMVFPLRDVEELTHTLSG